MTRWSWWLSFAPSSIFSHAWKTLENPWLQKRNYPYGSLHLHDMGILNPMFGCLSSFGVWCLHALGLTVPYAWKIVLYVVSNMHLEELPCTVLTVVVTANVRDMDDICFVYCKYYLVKQELSSEDPFCIGYCVSEFKTPAFIYLSLYFEMFSKVIQRKLMWWLALEFGMVEWCPPDNRERMVTRAGGESQKIREGHWEGP
jgi:hypothetical protein